MLKKLAFVAVLVILVFAAYASAAGLNVQGGSIQAGVDASLYCDDYVVVTGWGLETDDNSVRSVKVGDISTACQGNKMHVRLMKADGSYIGSQVSAIVDKVELTFSFKNPYPTPEEIHGIKIWIDGGNP